MSVWPEIQRPGSSLSTREGALVSVSITVDPRHLEPLLDALALISFPINPQIYHDAMIVYHFADQHDETESTTLVEFPAYADRIEEVTRMLQAKGFDPASVQVTSMLDEIHSEYPVETAPPGANYVSRYRLKTRSAAAVW